MESGIEYAEDGTVAFNGNHVLKAKSGGWKASSFLLGNLLLIPFIIIFLTTLTLFNIILLNIVTIYLSEIKYLLSNYFCLFFNFDRLLFLDVREGEVSAKIL